jgi:glycosyltransferase involved in cell wall biosynthesis
MSNQSKEIKKELRIDRDKKVVGFVGTFGPWHCIENLVYAISKIKDKSRDKDIIFLLMGDGVLKRYAVDKIGKFDNVIFTGNIPYSKIQYYLSICDVLVSPHSLQPGGRKFIGSPTKIFEYMEMGKGIVASNLGQIGEVLENKRTAILVELNNIDELVNGILKLADDKEMRLKLGISAAREVREKYTWGRNIKKLLNSIHIQNFHYFL